MSEVNPCKRFFRTTASKEAAVARNICSDNQLGKLGGRTKVLNTICSALMIDDVDGDPNICNGGRCTLTNTCVGG